MAYRTSLSMALIASWSFEEGIDLHCDAESLLCCLQNAVHDCFELFSNNVFRVCNMQSRYEWHVKAPRQKQDLTIVAAARMLQLIRP